MENNFHLLTPEYWAELEKDEPVVFSTFEHWLSDYRMRVDWDAFVVGNKDFYDLPADLQHGIIARFYFEAGELHQEFKQTQADWVMRTKGMFSALRNRLEELNAFK